MNKKIILSGIQPTGILTLGNYLGALKNWTSIQYEYDCRFFVADLHAITVAQDPAALRENTIRIIRQYIACGIDPDINTIFLQSHVHQHAELGWVLNCLTYMGELSRMTQYKDKCAKYKSIPVGLFDYPVLMAADILLYNADFVPVGEDQRQHLEITRNLAERFNSKYNKEVFKIPEAYIPPVGARIMSLQNPTKKMSKSDSNPLGFISLLDDRETVVNKVKKAVTDSENTVRYSDEQPGIKNLINIYSAITKKQPDEVEKEFEGAGYGKFKLAVADCIAGELEKIQEKYYKLNSYEHENYISNILDKGAKEAGEIAEKTLKSVYDAVGFISGK